MHILEQGNELNQQQPYGKAQKSDKAYPNAFFDQLCTMSDEEHQKDREYYQTKQIRNYFTERFKKAFKVHKHKNKLCFLRDGEYIPLGSSYYGFIVSPKGGLYAVKVRNDFQVENKFEIQNPQFNHSLFRAGQAVQTAGFFYYQEDTPYIQAAYRDSGHYKPTEPQHVRSCLGLMDAGFMCPATQIGGSQVGKGPLLALENYQKDKTLSHEKNHPTYLATQSEDYIIYIPSDAVVTGEIDAESDTISSYSRLTLWASRQSKSYLQKGLHLARTVAPNWLPTAEEDEHSKWQSLV